MAQIAPGGFRLRLNSLHIAGFKSFARPVTLEFPDGITALVGPNGSGKSNIVDAIRWCLGEQSARDLRGQRAEDVIHAGRRRVLGSAEVSLAFGPDADPELWLSRRLFRSGESDYLINGSRQRLRDVQAALSDLGMDHPRFVVVTQGMTDFLLSATAAERRALLEQAAGLASYRQRRDEAAHKLATSEGNMVTAEAVLAELEPRLRSLQRQVRAIEARDDLVARLQRRQAAWYTMRRNELEGDLGVAEAELGAALAERTSARQRLDALEIEAERAIERERAWQREMERASSALHAVQRELDSVEHSTQGMQGRLAQLERTGAALQQRLTELETETAAAEARYRDVVSDAKSARDALLAAQANEREAEERARLLAEEHAVLEREVLALDETGRRMSLERDRLAGEERALAVALADTHAQIQRLRAEAASLEETRGQLLAEEESARASAQDTRLRLDAAAESARASARSLAAIEEKTHRVRGLQTDIAQRLRSLTTQLDSTGRMYASLEREMSGTALAQLRVAPGAERAVNAALHAWNTDFAALGPDRRGFLQWRAGLASHFAPGTRWGDDLVSGDTIPAVLAATIVAPDEADAARLWTEIAPLAAHRVGSPPIQIVTPNGGVLAAAGRRVELTDDRGARFLMARADVAALERGLLQARRNEDRLSALASRVASQREQLAAADRTAHLELKTVQKEQYEAEGALHALEARQARLEREFQDFEAVIEERAAREEDLSGKLTRARGLLASVSRSCEEHHRAASEANERSVRMRSDLEQARRSAAESSQDAAILARRLRALEDMLGSSETETARLQREPARVCEEIEAITAETEEACEQVRRLEQSRVALAQIAEERAGELDATRRDRPAAGDTGPALREARGRSDRAIARFERAASRKGELETARLRLEDEIEREMGDAPFPETRIQDEPPPTEDEIRKLRARAAAYAEYDPSVVQEYRELVERRAYLTSQIEDLRAAASGLREVMRVADSEMRARFSEALARVSEEFDRVLRVMLRGGEGRLEQVEDGGIEVRASLPGKRVRSSASFSGGERALVASSLLFGVLRIRPAPFCVLDEVDAALDETNVDRYLDALGDLSTRMQTVVVTHNRATMAAATALYGLTMDRDGASSVLSLRLDQYDAVS